MSTSLNGRDRYHVRSSSCCDVVAVTKTKNTSMYYFRAELDSIVMESGLFMILHVPCLRLIILWWSCNEG
jgi:hypothetical protein